MAGGIEGQPGVFDLDAFAQRQGLPVLGGVESVTALHQRDRFRRGQNVLVAGARMVGMGVGDDGVFDRKGRVDKGVCRLYIEVMAKKLHAGNLGAGTAQNKALAGHPLTVWLEKRGWSWFPHQLETLAAAQQGDVLLCAPTGAGKTLSGFLPSLVELSDPNRKNVGLHTLYISPLKALTVDVHRNVGRPIEEMELPITYETRTGDTPAAKRARQKTKAPDILMTTPESLALLISYDNAAEYFKNLRYVIVDELHAVMTSKRGDLLALGLERLKTLAPGMKRIGLSATIPNPEIGLDWLSQGQGTIVQAPARIAPKIEILQTEGEEERLPWAGHMASYAMKRIYEAVRNSGMSIVFVNTRAQSELIFQNLWKLNEANLRIAVHHGSLERELRRKVEEKMAKGELDCVVATSSLDLGIDWAEVDLVVQIGAPKGVSRLLQRIGRSNHRLNEPSKALLVPTNRFEYLECVAAVEAIADKELDGAEPRTGGLDVLCQHVFGTACSAAFYPDGLFAEVTRSFPYRHLTRQDFDNVINFVSDGGYALRAYERYQRLTKLDDGRYALADPRMARQYRMNIGTIVEAPMLKVKMGKRTLGTIEEFFINNLAPGDTFLFAGQIVRFDGLHQMTVMVSKTSADKPKIPSYDGGKLPLSTHLSYRVRALLETPQAWRSMPDTVRDWLSLQADRSTLPGTDKLLVETFMRDKRHYMVAYPFAGRNAQQTLGFLIMRRMQRMGAKPLGFVANEYALAVWSVLPPQDIEALFSVDLLGEELHEWLEDTPLLKRTFREVAVIAGLTERRHPGVQKTGRQMTFSTDLIYDVLNQYEPAHILLRAARADATSGLIDTGRLSDMLIDMQNKLEIRKLDRVSPLAIPMLLEIAREGASRREMGDYFLEMLEHDLLEEAGFEGSEAA